MNRAQRISLVSGVVLATLYGAGMFLLFRKLELLPTIGFLMLVPVAMGAVPLVLHDEATANIYLTSLLAPWFTILSSVVVLVAIFREGAVCLLLIGSPLIVGVLLGSVIVFAVRLVRLSAARKRQIGGGLMLLPFLVIPLERRLALSTEEETVEDSIVVEAPADAIWAGLAEVETIDPDEYRAGFFHAIGVPRPIRATIDEARVGGVRVGEFEYGLTFREKIVRFDAPAQMTFSIDVDASTLREGSAERHAFEGGYFRFVDADYILRPVGGQGAPATRLTLRSRYAVTTSVNAYGRFWANAIGHDFQARLLEVLKARAERRASERRLEVAAHRSGAAAVDRAR